MENYPKSFAQPVSLSFAESSIPNQSVHFSMQKKGGSTLNFRIPATQLSALITNLERVREVMEDSGVDTGRGNTLVPAAPYLFFSK